MPDFDPWSNPSAAATTDVSDRAGRALGQADVIDRLARVLGHVIVDSGHVIIDSGQLDLSDRSARVLGQVDVLDEPTRALGLVGLTGPADVSDRAARALGVADISDRAARALGVADVSDRGGRRAGAVTPPGQWSSMSAPGLGVQATTTKAAAGAGLRHVCTGILATTASNASTAAGIVEVILRDGASGTGTVLLQQVLPIATGNGQGAQLIATRLFLPGSVNTAMTLELSAAVGNALERVTLIGYTTDSI